MRVRMYEPGRDLTTALDDGEWWIEMRVWRVQDGVVETMPLPRVADVLYGCGLIGLQAWIELTPNVEVLLAKEAL